AVLHAAGRAGLRESAPIGDHDAAVRRVIDWTRAAAAPPPEAVGHRVVHGGARYTGPVLIDPEVMGAIEALEALAPLHNGPSLAGIRAAREQLGPVPMVAVFDTAFHSTLPEHAYRYALPYDLSLRHGLRRFGFHGISYAF